MDNGRSKLFFLSLSLFGLFFHKKLSSFHKLEDNPYICKMKCSKYNMKKTCLTSILVLFSLVAMAQGGLDVYLSPFDFPIVFSGNFGEIRANHFHGGLDFKTQGATGKPI